MSLNKVQLIGFLGQEPDVKTLQGGSTVAKLSVATSERWVDKQGQKQEKTEWHRVEAWGKLAEICQKYLTKGRQVYVEGKLQTRMWEKEGQKHYSTEIVASTVQFLGPNPEARSSSGAPAGYGQEPSFDQHEEIPF